MTLIPPRDQPTRFTLSARSPRSERMNSTTVSISSQSVAKLPNECGAASPTFRSYEQPRKIEAISTRTTALPQSLISRSRFWRCWNVQTGRSALGADLRCSDERSDPRQREVSNVAPRTLTVLAAIRRGEEEPLRAVLRAIGDDIKGKRLEPGAVLPRIEFRHSRQIH